MSCGLIWWFVCCVVLGFCFVYCGLVLSGCILVFSCVCFGGCDWLVGWVGYLLGMVWFVWGGAGVIAVLELRLLRVWWVISCRLLGWWLW